MKPPLISIITVVHNNAKFIRDSIHSVLTQDYPHIEYLIIDGDSSDGTIDVIEEYREDISVFLSEVDDGIYHAMNKGLNLASGEIVGFLHSDDVLASTDTVSSICTSFSSQKVDAVYGDLVYVRAKNIGSSRREIRLRKSPVPPASQCHPRPIHPIRQWQDLPRGIHRSAM